MSISTPTVLTLTRPSELHAACEAQRRRGRFSRRSSPSASGDVRTHRPTRSAAGGVHTIASRQASHSGHSHRGAIPERTPGYKGAHPVDAISAGDRWSWRSKLVDAGDGLTFDSSPWRRNGMPATASPRGSPSKRIAVAAGHPMRRSSELAGSDRRGPFAVHASRQRLSRPCRVMTTSSSGHQPERSIVVMLYRGRGAHSILRAQKLPGYQPESTGPLW